MKIHTHIEGSLNFEQQKQHLPFAFTVPPGATTLTIEFDYAPKRSQGQGLWNDLSLTLFDPEGARGARHNHPDRNLTITAHTATPGYTPGALQAGTWTVWIDAHRVLPPDTLHYHFDIVITDEPLTDTAQTWTQGTTAPRGHGWYRGDLHGHSLHSDAMWDVRDLVEHARAHGLDFVALTDHNTVSPLAEMDSYSADDMLTIGGMELTTYYGHALALGIRRWQPWRVGVDADTMSELAERAVSGGATFIIAHPMAVGDPFCTGCDWNYPDMMPGSARVVEIWNGVWASESRNEQAVQLWYRWLNQGYRMAATAGRDIHTPLDIGEYGYCHVCADDLSESAILEAVRKGHLYISTRPQVELTANSSEGHSGMMGDIVSGETVDVTFAWRDSSEGDQLVIVVDGKPASEEIPETQGQRTWTLRADEARWTVAEIRAADGSLRAITNPIFLGSERDWR